MKKILIFRTDRIGDFLVISPIISSVLRNIRNCSVDIVCSKRIMNLLIHLNVLIKFFYIQIIYLKISFF